MIRAAAEVVAREAAAADAEPMLAGDEEVSFDDLFLGEDSQIENDHSLRNINNLVNYVNNNNNNNNNNSNNNSLRCEFQSEDELSGGEELREEEETLEISGKQF